MILTESQKKAIEATVNDLFNRLKVRLLGRFFSGPAIYFEIIRDHDPIETVEGIYRYTLGAMFGPEAKPDTKRIKSLAKITENYLNAERLKTINNIITSAEQGKDLSEVEDLVRDSMDKASRYVKTVVNTEVKNIQAYAERAGIEQLGASIGLDDPTVAKLGKVDGKLCPVCRDLWHTDENIYVPKVYKLSQLRDGYNRDQKNPTPTVGTTHPHCFTGDVKIHTSKGLFTVKELFDLKAPFGALVDKRIGNRYDSFRDRGAAILPSSHVYETGIQKILKISTSSGSITVSEGHDIWIHQRGGPPVLKKASEVKAGEKMLIVSGESCFGGDHWPKEAELLGSFYGDGHEAQGMTLQFFNEDIPYGEKLHKLTRELFGNRHAHRSSNELKKFSNRIYNENIKYVKFSSIGLYRFAVNKGYINKQCIPHMVWKSDKETVVAFLRGLYAADGTVNKGKIGSSVVLGTSIPSFAEDVRLLLVMLGIKAKIYKTKGGNKIKFSDGNGGYRESVSGDLYRVVIAGRDLLVFADTVGFPVSYKQDKLLECIKKYKPAATQTTATIISVEETGNQQTYCMTQPFNNTVTANGFVVGQCRHTLTMVPPNFGFNNRGQIVFKGFGYDEYEEQRK